MTAERSITFEQAKARYVHRYTMEHKPEWSNNLTANGKYYAPQYASDQEWYEHTLFPGEGHIEKRERSCQSSRQSWPLGYWLDEPFTPGRPIKYV